MNKEEQIFIDTIKSFYNKIIKDSLVYMEKPKNKKEFLLNLRQNLINQHYQPDIPREYIVFNKHNYVSRIVPTFTLQDYCVYFYCIKKLEECLCEDRVEGTFGAWKLPPSKIQTCEELDKEGLLNEVDYIPYCSFSSLSIKEWIKNWKDFSKLTYSKYNTFFADDNGNKVVVIFDIANFYDNIKIDVLEKKLRLKCSDNKMNHFIDLLIYFLRYWNKPFEGYSPKSVGIPQEETGDCSRLLANFYLQKYDKFIVDQCNFYKAEYLRYSDDMMIFAPSKDIAEKLIFEASKRLHKIGLNINTGKVQFLNKKDFYEYEAFEILEILSPETKYIETDDIKKAIYLFLSNEDRKVKFHKERVLKRFITVLSQIDLSNIDKNLLKSLVDYILDDESLSNSNAWYLQTIYGICKKIGYTEFLLEKLDNLIYSVNFNSFHYNLKKFYKKCKINFDERLIDNEILKRKIGVYNG